MAALSYTEQLKHPNWQRRRLEILNNSGFKCSMCGSTDKTLHIHHCYYEKGKKAWEYPDSALRCLCEECHKRAGAQKREIDVLLGKLRSADSIYGYGLGVYLDSERSEVIEVLDCEVADGLVDYFGIEFRYGGVDLFDWIADGGNQFSFLIALWVIFQIGSSKPWLQGLADSVGKNLNWEIVATGGQIPLKVPVNA